MLVPEFKCLPAMMVLSSSTTATSTTMATIELPIALLCQMKLLRVESLHSGSFRNFATHPTRFRESSLENIRGTTR